MHLLVLGATSDIAQALASRFAAEEGADLTLASRDLARLEKIARDLEIRHGVKVRTAYFDAADFPSHAGFFRSVEPEPDGVIAAFGLLGEQKRAQQEFAHALEVITVNYLGMVSILEIVADRFERRGSGLIIGLSSVAGERGRMSNYIYGSAKAGMTAFLSGLRNRLSRAGVRVITVLPGFVATRMTEGMDLPPRLLATPEQAARDIHRAFRGRSDVVYTKPVWRWIMMVIRSMPEPIFKKTKL
jgi:decaprenylphospho-beta-D-erythro-pentofuranosid-2-ulose 2-reductase